jgi:hypothetical protein
MSEDLDKAFYNLTVHQRNVAWEEAAVLRKELDALKEENADYDRLVTLLGKRLTDTANALKGGPPPDSLHGWHDLPFIAQRFRDVLDDINEGDCEYNDGCPENAGTRHYECTPCKARKAIEAKMTDEDVKKIEEADEQTIANIKAELEKWKLKTYWLNQSLHDARQDRILWEGRAFKNGADGMQQAIIDIMHQHSVAPEVIARVVELDYPEFERGYANGDGK